VTSHPGLYFVGLPWQHTWGSGRFAGVADDAEYLAEQIVRARRPALHDGLHWLAGLPRIPDASASDEDWIAPRTVA
jgi:putative flavoprotein involved in K+ transport